MAKHSKQLVRPDKSSARLRRRTSRSEAEELEQLLKPRVSPANSQSALDTRAQGPVAQMQQHAGNQAVSRLVQRTAATDPLQRNAALSLLRKQGAAGAKVPNTALSQASPLTVQRKPVQNVTSVGLFRDVGNGLFGSDTPVTKNDVLQIVRAIRASDVTTGSRTNIKILTGTHGTATGHLVGEQLFFQEDLENEGHKGGGGWVNVHNVRNKSKSQIGSWKDSRANFAVIMAWCYSAKSEENWANVHASWGKGSDGKHIWAW